MQPDSTITEQRLTIVPDEMQAEMIRAVLADHGVSCVVRRPALGEVQWGSINTGMGGPREIIVDASELDVARALIEAPADGMPDSSMEYDVVLEERGRLFGRVFALSAVVLFGLPLAGALIALVLDTLGVI